MLLFAPSKPISVRGNPVDRMGRASFFYLPRERKVYKRVRVAFRSGEVDVVEVGLSLFRFSFIYQEMLGDRVSV